MKWLFVYRCRSCGDEHVDEIESDQIVLLSVKVSYAITTKADCCGQPGGYGVADLIRVEPINPRTEDG